MFVIKMGTFFLKVVMWNKLDTVFLHPTPISASYSSDFAYRPYHSLIVKKLKIEFSPKGLICFFLKFWIQVLLIPDKNIC